MIRALGVSENPFDARDPGRLCRGRERWIEPWDPDDADPRPLWRTVVSGAAFSDDGAADARRGTAWSGVDCAAVIDALFPGRKLLGFMEDGHPADIPESAEGVELYEGYRAGGRQELPLVRWHVHVSDPEAVRALVGDAAEERIRGFAVLPKPAKGQPALDEDGLRDALFALVGFSTLDSPPARFQPMALGDVLSRVEAVVVLHRDKHGPAVAVYSREALPDVSGRLRLAADTVSQDILLVPFAIPPMLARWDRALAELREVWPGPGEFPVPKGPPPPPEHGRFQRRGRRRWREDDLAEDVPDDLLVATEAVDEALVPGLADEEPPADDGAEE